MLNDECIQRDDVYQITIHATQQTLMCINKYVMPLKGYHFKH